MPTAATESAHSANGVRGDLAKQVRFSFIANFGDGFFR